MNGNSSYLWIASGTYSMFLLFLRAKRPWESSRPFRRILWLHLVFSPLYVFSSWILSLLWPCGPWLGAEWWIGLFVYFAFHYGGFIHIYGQIDRGFSLNLLLATKQAALLKQSEFVLLEDVCRHFANGQGTNALESDRIENLVSTGALRKSQTAGSEWELSSWARIVVRLNRVLLNFWNLDYLGRPR